MDGFAHMGMGMPGGMFLPGGMPGMMQMNPGIMDPDFGPFSQVVLCVLCCTVAVQVQVLLLTLLVNGARLTQ